MQHVPKPSAFLSIRGKPPEQIETEGPLVEFQSFEQQQHVSGLTRLEDRQQADVVRWRGKFLSPFLRVRNS